MTSDVRRAELGDAPVRARAGASRPAFGIGVAAIALLVVARVLAPSGTALGDRVQDFVTLAISVVLESAPFVFLGVLLSVVVQIWLPAALFDRLLPRTPVLRRAAISLLGVLLPVCECGNVPLARGLIQRGMTVAESMTFLLAAPIVNPITIVTTAQAFGWSDGILVARVLGGFAIANLVGWLVSRHPRQHELLTPRFEAMCRVHDRPRSDDTATRLRRSAASFAEETGSMLPALVVGAGLAAAIQVLVPRQVLLALGANPVWSVLALMALAFVVAICSNVDAFFILSFGGTFLPGGIVAFLVFGPLVDVKMLALLRTTFTARALLLVVSVVFLCSLVLGFGVNLLA